MQTVSGQSLTNVQAVVSWYGEGGRFITSDSALIEYNPILEGQTSPFTVTTRTNPAMRTFTIEFKELMGGTLRTRDDSQQARAGDAPATDNAPVPPSFRPLGP